MSIIYHPTAEDADAMVAKGHEWRSSHPKQSWMTSLTYTEAIEHGFAIPALLFGMRDCETYEKVLEAAWLRLFRQRKRIWDE